MRNRSGVMVCVGLNGCFCLEATLQMKPLTILTRFGVDGRKSVAMCRNFQKASKGGVTVGKKKKSFKVSHTRKLRDKSREFFAKYKNNVTRRAFINNYDKFIVFCRTFYDCKTKDECKNHIDDYVDYLKQKGLSPSTIHAYLSPVVLYHGMTLGDIEIPQRCSAKNTRSRKGRTEYRPNANPNTEKYFLSVEFQKRVGIRRAELCKLCRDDFVIDESGYPCVRVNRGKGGKMQLQRILPDDVEFVKEYFDGTENRLFSSEEMKNKIDYHHMRAVQAVRAYRYYSEKICLEPGYQKKLETEIIKRWNCYNLDKNGKPKRFDKSEISGTYKIRGENKKLALKNGLPTEYSRLAVMAVSVFHLSHWRLDVTVSNYLLAV